MPTIEDIRRRNLAILVEELGSIKALAAKINRSPTQVSQLLHGIEDWKSGTRRGMRATTARHIEVSTDKPVSWLDRQAVVSLDQAFSLCSLGATLLDPDNRSFIRVSDSFAAMTGYTKEELVGKSAADITYPADRDWDAAAFHLAIEKGDRHQVEKRYIKKDGGIIWVRLNIMLIRDDTGKAIKTITMSEDITERRLLEEAILQAMVASSDFPNGQ